jgi:hypothetical protein
MLSVNLYGNGKFNHELEQILTRRRNVVHRGPFDRTQRNEALCAGVDVVVIATTSFLVDVAEDVLTAVRHGSNVVTTAEEASFPRAVDAVLGDELDAAAKENGVSILGTGLNPGFAFDTFVVCATGAARTVDSLRVERVVDLSGFS